MAQDQLPPPVSERDAPTHAGASTGPRLAQLFGPGRGFRKFQRIFVCRNLDLAGTRMLGFDMDYTLAIYRKEHIERLAFQVTIDKLVTNKGYDPAIRSLVYDRRAMVRGLVVDRKRGSILKTDQYGHVAKARHGGTMLTADQLRSVYGAQRIRLNNERFYSIDTLFGLPEAHLYAQLVGFLDAKNGSGVDYWKIFDDVRECLDRSHQDNSIKARVVERPGDYIVKDKLLAPTLQKLREAGKRLFLLTNSAWDYTDRVMGFLLDGALDDYPKWPDYFDRIVVDAGKPEFFRSQLPFEDLSGHPIDGEALAGTKTLRKGNHRLLERAEGHGGESVLFVGDHIYGDILRSKESGGWRTAMIIEELEEELAAAGTAQGVLEEIRDLEAKANAMDFERNRLQKRVDKLSAELDGMEVLTGKANVVSRYKRHGIRKYIERLKRRLSRIDEQIRVNDEASEGRRLAYDRTFNELWGPLFKEGNELSRFGQQVQRFACLYTARVSNFLFYPTSKSFRSPIELLPHDL